MCPAQPSRLDSWKAIAEYLGRNVRTVTRWADERGMPVHRVPGRKRGAVFAFATEIDAWLVSQDVGAAHTDESGAAALSEEDSAKGEGGVSPALESDEAVAGGTGSDAAKHVGQGWAAQEEMQVARGADDIQSVHKNWFGAMRWRLGIVVAGVLVAGIALAVTLRPATSQPSELASVKLSADTLEGQDARGQTLWTYRYPQLIRDEYYEHGLADYRPERVADYFGDGSREVAVMATLHGGPNTTDFDHGQVDFFTSTGKLIWRYLPDDSFQFGTHKLSGPWFFSDLYVSRNKGRSEIWAAAMHGEWGNSFVAQLDPATGKGKLRFVNTGTLYRLNEIKASSKAYLLVGGFNNEWDGGSLAILDEAKPFGASPQTPATRHHCDSCPPGDPDYYFVFPRSEINRMTSSYDTPVFDIRVTGSGIELVKSERMSVGQEKTIYLLSSQPPFRLLSLRYDSNYDSLHQAWSADGKLAHTLENCPERKHPQPVRLWTPSAGWTEIAIKPAGADQ
jgi:hypothetical protein